MKLRLALVATLLLAADASAQVTTTPTGPAADFCAPRLISYGPSPVSGSGLGCYRLDGAAGDRVRLRAAPASVVSVVSPAGNAFCSGTQPTCTLPTTGRYQVTVTGSGPHGLTAQRLNAPLGCTTLLTGNPPVTGTLTAGGAPCYRVNGQPGMRLRVRLVPLTGAIDPVAEVVRASGMTSCAATSSDDATCVLGTTGLHTILVRDGAAGTGTYAIELKRLDALGSCGTVTFGTVPVTDGLYGGASDCLRFDAAAGDRVRIRVRADGPSPTLHPMREILRPDGTTLCTAVRIEEQTCTIDTAGTHAILVRDAPPGSGGGVYQVGVQRLNDPVGCTPGWISPDSTRAALAIGETHCLRVFGTTGDRLRTRVVAGNDFAFDVIRPDGSTRCGVNAGADCLLDATGFHTILVRDTSWGAFGAYWWSLQRLNNPAGCQALTRNAPAEIGPLGLADSPCWRFAGTDDEQIQIKLHKLSGDFKLQLELVGPSGQFGSRYSTTGAIIDSFWRLHETGTHTLIVNDGDAGPATGTYDLAVIGD